MRSSPKSGHSGFVNSCHPTRRGTQLIASGSDDCSIKVWDPRKKGKATTLVNPYQVLTVSFNDTSEQVFSSGIDNEIKVLIIFPGLLKEISILKKSSIMSSSLMMEHDSVMSP